MLLPLDDGPGWLQAVAAVNPVNWIVQAERALLSGDLANSTVAWGGGSPPSLSRCSGSSSE